MPEVVLESSAEQRPDPARSCIFCRPADPEMNTVLARSRRWYARWDNFPAQPGHLKLVPFRHIPSFFDLTSQEMHDLRAIARSARSLLHDRFRPDGYTIGINDGQAAGASITHLHIHIIPRWHGDLPNPRGGIRRLFPHCDDALDQAAAATPDARPAEANSPTDEHR
ncbi:HIT family protein [Nocardia xishanensis]|uniref:HIT family protein n=1 Tax=Nocardia xishanensis TaxID=238964 RepID=UPI00082CC1E2|nr:HIT domain-containing protein [Nocardia xishanensis]